MVLGLGYLTYQNESSQAFEFFMAAEACIMQTPFMFRPSRSALRTLCLMIIAKYLGAPTCWGFDACWSLLGTLVRLAILSGINRQDQPTVNDGDRAEDEWESQHSLWITIQYLDVKASIGTGMPPLVVPETTPSHTPSPPPSDASRHGYRFHQAILRESLPLLNGILSRLNSTSAHLTYDEVSRYNLEIRRRMQQLTTEGEPDTPQLTSLCILFRRILLTLHCDFALRPDAPQSFPDSYWSSLECSLAILVHQHDHHDGVGAEPRHFALLSGIDALDSFSAGLTVCSHLLRADAPLAEASSTDRLVPPKQIILESLQSYLALWYHQKERSPCYQAAYRLLRAVLNMITENLGVTTEGLDLPSKKMPPRPVRV